MFLLLLPLILAAAGPPAQEPVQVDVGPWALMGPFQHGDPGKFEQNHPPEEQALEMVAGTAWDPAEHPVELVGSFLEWKEVKGSNPRGDRPFDVGRFDLVALTGQAAARQAAFLYSPIHCTAATEQTVLFGSDDGFVMWLNGQRIAERGKLRGANPFEERVILQLQPGWNHLLVEVTQLGGSWAFEMQAPRAVDQIAINQAVDRGVKYLLGRQLLDGSWANRQTQYRNGATALALYTLLKSEVSPQHPAILRGFEYLRTEPSDRTYSVGCELMALSALDDPSVLPWMEERAEDLISWQDSLGTWSYPDGHWDMSCTQFAVLGLRAAAQSGVEIPAKVWDDAIRGTFMARQKVRRSEGTVPTAFSYYPEHPSGPSGSMTTAGIAVLAIAKEQLGARLTPAELQKIDEAIDAGVAWLAQEFSLSKNPGPNSMAYFYYWLYGVERVGALLEIDRMGRHDWYAEGASFLVTDQGGSGEWRKPWGDMEIATCFSLLFLNKATAAAVTGQSLAEASKRHHATTAAAGKIELHAVDGDPIVLWVVPPESIALQEASYFARRPGGDWQALGPGEGRRLARKISFDSPGRWQLRAEANAENGIRFDSAVLEITYEVGVRDEELRYASDSLRNRMPAYRPAVTVSSQQGVNSGDRLVDNAWWSFWTCDPGDRSPTLEIKLRKKAKVQRILLSQAHTRKAEQEIYPRVATIELWLNRDKRPTIYKVETSAARKTVIELPPRTRINFLRIRITEIVGGALGRAAAGFSEIELQ